MSTSLHIHLPENSKNGKSLLHCNTSLHKQYCSSTITDLTSIAYTIQHIYKHFNPLSQWKVGSCFLTSCGGTIRFKDSLQLCKICHVWVWTHTIINRYNNCLLCFSLGVHNLSRGIVYRESFTKRVLKEVKKLLVSTLVATGTISSLSLPDAIAAAARLWDSTCL